MRKASLSFKVVEEVSGGPIDLGNLNHAPAPLRSHRSYLSEMTRYSQINLTLELISSALTPLLTATEVRHGNH